MARYIAPKIVRYVGNSGVGDLVEGVAPPARVEYLTALQNATLGLLTTPYAVPIVCRDFGDGAGTSLPDLHAAPMVLAPATRAFVPFFSRSIDVGSTGTQVDAASYTYDEADPFNADYAVPVASPFSQGTDAYPMTDQTAGVYGDSEEVETPADATNRAHRVLTSFQARLVRFLVTRCQGFSGVPFQTPNMDTM